MATEMVNLGIQVDKKQIEDNVTRLVAASIANALGDRNTIVQDAITRILTTYVNKNSGEVCRESDWNKISYIDWLAKQVVEQTVREEINRAVKENDEAFRAAILKELSKPQNRQNLAKSFIDAILRASTAEWKMPISITFEKARD